MMMTPKPKFTVLMICITSVLNTSSSEVILINFRAHVQFHSDSSSSTRILESFNRIVRLDFFTRMLGSFTRMAKFSLGRQSFTRMTIFSLGRQSDDYIFTRKAISYSNGKFSFDGNLFTRMIIISLGRKTFTRPVSFHSDGKLSLDR